MINDLNYHFSVESDRLKVTYPFDYDNMIHSISSLNKPDGSDPVAISAYNDEYLKIYMPNDASSEFHSNLCLGTFDSSKVKPDFEDLTVDYPSYPCHILISPALIRSIWHPISSFGLRTGSWSSKG